MISDTFAIEALGSPKHFLTPFFASADIGIAFFDHALRFQSANNTLAAMTGFPTDALLGQSVRQIVGPVADDVEPRFKRTFAGETVFFELTAKLPARSNISSFVQTYLPLKNARNKVITACAVVIEVTEKKKVERLMLRLTGKLLYLNAILTQHLEGLSINSRDRRDGDSQLIQSVSLVEKCTSEIIEVLNLVRPSPGRPSKKLLTETNSFLLSSIPKSLPLLNDGLLLRRLSQREHGVLRLLASNKGNKQIAVALGISVRTVEAHRRSIMDKLGMHSLSELIHIAIRNGIVDA
jgi:PAS domain S-box-containing protein